MEEVGEADNSTGLIVKVLTSKLYNYFKSILYLLYIVSLLTM
jgi:hypothetical protein